MIHYPHFNPIAVHVGPLSIHWYGICYVISFIGIYMLACYRARKRSDWKNALISDLIFYAALGVIIGGRLGEMIFYEFHDWMLDPWLIVRIWEGGMSFHGGFLGAIVGGAIWSYLTGRNWFDVTDFIAPLVPIGLALGRLGNFINGELWGRITDVPWAMIFPAADAHPRHPSQLYELFLEGIVLWVILWNYSKQAKPRGAVSALFLFYYGIFRFLIEYVREPTCIEYGLTIGQWLSLPMVLSGLLWWSWICRVKKNGMLNAHTKPHTKNKT